MSDDITPRRPTPKWTAGDPKAANRTKTDTFGKMHERKTLKAMKVRATPRSGQGRTKGDGRLVIPNKHDPDDGPIELHVEIKSTANRKGMHLPGAELEKLREQAGSSREPVLVMNIVDSRGRVDRWVAMTETTFTKLTGRDL